MIRNIKNFTIAIYRGTKNIWHKYHFIVPPRLWKKYARFLWAVLTEGITIGPHLGAYYNPLAKIDYLKWLKKQRSIKCDVIKLENKPKISVLVPVYNAKGEFLRECIESILKQTYTNYEICIVDDASTSKETLEVLREYEANEKIKIKYRKTNGHISEATNDALAMAKGEFIALVDNDDVIEGMALCKIVKVLNENKELDFIYTDEDKIDLDGRRCEPHFKPDFSPDTLLSMNYICHLSVIRTSLVREVGGFEVGLEGAQDHDLFLKIVEKTKNIYHIPEVLYHWRMTETSTALNAKNKKYAADKSKMAIMLALKRRGINGHVEKDEKSGYYRVIYDLKKEPLVSILIPTRDYAETLETCLKSIYKKTTYKNYEVIVINNNSKEKKTFDLFKKYKKMHDNFVVVDANIEFNYSKINNLAVGKAGGEVLLFLNNDTEVITPRWLEMMVGYAVQPHVGAVGAKLFYPDGTVQHAGVVLGLGGVASHVYLEESRESVGIYGRLRVPYDYAAVTGACLCIERKKFNQVGGLEEDLKVAYNDIDLNIKLLQAGYYNVELPMVELYHFESKSRGSDLDPDKIDRFCWEQEYMWKKWRPWLESDVFYNPNYSKNAWFLLDKGKVNKREMKMNGEGRK